MCLLKFSQIHFGPVWQCFFNGYFQNLFLKLKKQKRVFFFLVFYKNKGVQPIAFKNNSSILIL